MAAHKGAMGLDRHDWVSVILIVVALVPHMALAVDRWVHRTREVGSSHASKIRHLQDRADSWDRRFDDIKRKMSEESSRQQEGIGRTELQLVRIEEHLRYVDRDIQYLQQSAGQLPQGDRRRDAARPGNT